MRNTFIVVCFLLSLSPSARASPMALDQRDARTTMLDRFAWVRECLGDRDSAFAQILCDVEPLDLAAADGEIGAIPNLDGESRARERELARAVLREQTRSRQQLAALATQEPAVRRRLAIAEQQQRDWQQPTPARATLIALVEQVEAATASHERSAFADCETPTRAAWAEIVRSRRLPAVSLNHTLEALRDAVFLTPEAYLAHRAFALCIAGRGPDGTALLYADASTQRRNWRTSTIAAWSAASRMLAPLNPALDPGDHAHGASTEAPATCATIVRLTAIEGGVRVELQGRSSIELDAALAEGLRPGMRLVTVNGAAIVATASATSSKATWLFGVALP